MATLKQTVLNAQHVSLGAQMVEFGGWDMPVQYPSGILKEHLATRRLAGLFDVSHMGRFVVGGPRALDFLQHALTNNAAALDVGQSQYTLISDATGAAIDDAYLYRFRREDYLLVVNAANREKDWDHLNGLAADFDPVSLADVSEQMAMISLQGPLAKQILIALIDDDRQLPLPERNAVSIAHGMGTDIWLARTGYTGEPLCFELFMENEQAVAIWRQLIELGAQPVGLGARDTLRLEAGLPLYGHELGLDPDGRDIPIFAIPLSRFAVSFAPGKGDFVGKAALLAQYEALKSVLEQRPVATDALPRRVQMLELTGKGVARAGAKVFCADRHVGYITSGTMVPYWVFSGHGLSSQMTEETQRRAIALALIDSRMTDGDACQVQVRGRMIDAVVMPYLLRSEAPPFARAITCQRLNTGAPALSAPAAPPVEALDLVRRAIANTQWRQQACINLIPSEQTASPATRMLSILDPAGRYAEHKAVKAFSEAEVFYYQGTDFIAAVEVELQRQMGLFLGCDCVETRPVSGQMANAAVYSALVDFINRTDRKSEQRRLRSVLNHHIINGGHLSAQPMGALRDFVARDPMTERPAVVNFPVRADNPYQIDLAACGELISAHRPELIILGKSMTLHTEPVAEIRAMVDELDLDTVVMYDMAHVLGLTGPHFQQPFAQGADLVTGSTHKTFFGTQRGVIGMAGAEQNLERDLWEAIQRRAFPGSVSNHHLGTLLGLLMAAYEMNAFKDQYQPRVIANARAFARALADCGLQVAGDPDIGYTETHQVIVNVGYAGGADMARRLEANNIIVNYQAAPGEEGFSAAGALRMGVAEMTRFGMAEKDFQALAQLMADVILNDATVKEKIAELRQSFLQLQYCFDSGEMTAHLEQLHRLI